MKKIIIVCFVTLLLVSGCSSQAENDGSPKDTADPLNKSDYEMQKQQYEKDESLQLKAISLTDCEEIKSDILKDNCQYEIITDEAVSTQNISRCSKLKDDTRKMHCENAFNTIVTQ